MKRTSFFRTLVLVLFCALATGLGSLHAQTHNAPPPPQKADMQKMQQERLRRQTPPPVQSGNSITAVAPEGTNASTKTAPPVLRSPDGTVTKIAQEDMAAYKSKPAPPVVGTRATKESTEAWIKQFTTWKAQTPNYRNVMTPVELEMVDNNKLGALYLHHLHAPAQRNPNSKP